MVPNSIRNCLTSAVLIALGAEAQEKAHLPRFEDYPVAQVFKGTPAAPALVTRNQKRFWTRIRDGVANGMGVLRDGIEQPGPNFDGHYIVVQWQFGSPGEMMAIVDANTGRVYNPPLSEDFMLPFLYEDGHLPSPADVNFRQNSALMIVKASPKPRMDGNYTYYFLWENNRWRILNRVPLKLTER